MNTCIRCKRKYPDEYFYESKPNVCRGCLQEKTVNVENMIYRKFYRSIDKEMYYCVVKRVRSERFDTLEEARAYRDKKLSRLHIVEKDEKTDWATYHKGNPLCQPWR